ncbi:hypothetical protein GCM10029964_042690 [Kibdelosporangium lantanae]
MPTAIEYGLELPSAHTVSLIHTQNGSAGGPPAEAAAATTEPTTTWVAAVASLAVVVVGVGVRLRRVWIRRPD